MKEISRKNVSIKVTIPGVNECPFDKAEKWAKEYYRKVRTQVSRRRAKAIKEQLPIETATYAEKMTFGLWRLFEPKSQEKSPCDTVLDFLKSYTALSKWGQFKPKLTKQLKIAFTAICNSDYDPAMVTEMNKSINALLAEFTNKEVTTHLNFVLNPKRVEYLYSKRLLGIISLIYEYYTGKPLNMKRYPQPPRPNGPRQMEMHLDIQISRA